MRKLTYYIAVTVDGFIAGPRGEFDFFPIELDVAAAMNAAQPETVPTAIREQAGLADAPNKRFDTVLMGRNTYELGTASPYAHLKQYVFSRTLTAADPAVTVVSGDPVAVVRDLKQQAGMGIWLCGGGALAGQLVDEIDDLIVKRYPIVIGAGIPLFDGPFRPARFTLADRRAFSSGVDVLTYTS